MTFLGRLSGFKLTNNLYLKLITLQRVVADTTSSFRKIYTYTWQDSQITMAHEH